MGPPQLSNVVRWQIIGMREAGMSLRQIAQRIDHHHSTVSRIANKHRFARDQEVPYYILKRGQCPRTPS